MGEKIVFLSSSSQNSNEKTNNLTLSTTAPSEEGEKKNEEKEVDDVEELTSSSSSSTLFGGKMIIWKNIIRSLLNNIIDHPEQNTNATGYSLRILRLLYELEKEEGNSNVMLLPLLQRSLFAQLSYLVEFGEHYRFPMIQTEASYLFNNVCSKRKGRMPSDDTVRVRINNFTTFYRIYDIADRRLHLTRSDEIVSSNKNEYVYVGGR